MRHSLSTAIWVVTQTCFTPVGQHCGPRLALYTPPLASPPSVSPAWTPPLGTPLSPPLTHQRHHPLFGQWTSCQRMHAPGSDHPSEAPRRPCPNTPPASRPPHKAPQLSSPTAHIRDAVASLPPDPPAAPRCLAPPCASAPPARPPPAAPPGPRRRTAPGPGPSRGCSRTTRRNRTAPAAAAPAGGRRWAVAPGGARWWPGARCRRRGWARGSGGMGERGRKGVKGELAYAPGWGLGCGRAGRQFPRGGSGLGCCIFRDRALYIRRILKHCLKNKCRGCAGRQDSSTAPELQGCPPSCRGARPTPGCTRRCPGTALTCARDLSRSSKNEDAAAGHLVWCWLLSKSQQRRILVSTVCCPPAPPTPALRAP